jgi:hypothetical protein
MLGEVLELSPAQQDGAQPAAANVGSAPGESRVSVLNATSEGAERISAMSRGRHLL